ncbi:MAG TPA: sigma-54 dependent transcriptional regulator [Acidisarcina sp.]
MTITGEPETKGMSCHHSPLSPGWPGAVLASPDSLFRSRVRDCLVSMHWRVLQARGGAEALAHLSAARCEALILDSWLPDLEIGEFIMEFKRLHPGVDLVVADEGADRHSVLRGPRGNELLHAVRQGQQTIGSQRIHQAPRPILRLVRDSTEAAASSRDPGLETPAEKEQAGGRRLPFPALGQSAGPVTAPSGRPVFGLPELVGNHPLMIEVARRVRLVAPHPTPVLIQGATGTGKELIARALHRLSPRHTRPFVALNCAAIPESLLETELFGHARGAFTGAVQRRTGRIQAADGGTLLLDEIGDMPLSLQAKLLRFVESGELQPVGENATVSVDVRLIAATHRPLGKLSREGAFRSDLYYRLAVFVIAPPPLSARPEDIEALAEHFLEKAEPCLNQRASLTRGALDKLQGHGWPGNVRELEHVIARALILAERRTEIMPEEIEFAWDPQEF